MTKSLPGTRSIISDEWCDLYFPFSSGLWISAVVKPQLDEHSASTAEPIRDKGFPPRRMSTAPARPSRNWNADELFEKQLVRGHCPMDGMG
jgi:hypothetical protein